MIDSNEAWLHGTFQHWNSLEQLAMPRWYIHVHVLENVAADIKDLGVQGETVAQEHSFC